MAYTSRMNLSPTVFLHMVVCKQTLSSSSCNERSNGESLGDDSHSHHSLRHTCRSPLSKICQTSTQNTNGSNTSCFVSYFCLCVCDFLAFDIDDEIDSSAFRSSSKRTRTYGNERFHFEFSPKLLTCRLSVIIRFEWVFSLHLFTSTFGVSVSEFPFSAWCVSLILGKKGSVPRVEFALRYI